MQVSFAKETYKKDLYSAKKLQKKINQIWLRFDSFGEFITITFLKTIAKLQVEILKSQLYSHVI